METHLNDSQIEKLLGLVASGAEDTAVDSQFKNDLNAHLDVCESCRLKVNAQATAMQRLALLEKRGPSEPTSQCPPEAVWVELAAGISTGSQENYLNHASQCDHCGPLLQQSVADFAAVLTAEEESQIARLRSHSHSWQNSMAQRLKNFHSQDAEQHLSRKASLFSLQGLLRPRLIALSAAAITLLALGTWYAINFEHDRNAEHLIADAYQEKRTIELRMVGAPYVPLRQERGSGSEEIRMNRPALLKAEAEISQQLRSHPDDIQWLQAKGRASMLENSPASAQNALDTLTIAQNLDKNNISISIDLASAHILRGQFNDDISDFGEAINILGPIVKSHTGGEVALFNYAIALEQHICLAQALSSWEEFLKQYPKSEWAQEAQAHSSRLHQEIQDHKDRCDIPLKTVDQLATAFQHHDENEIAKIDSRIEEYQDFALQQWLPQYFLSDKDGAVAQMQLASAIEGVAQLLFERHNDPWLKDLLKADRNSPQVREAIQLLADSSNRIETSDESLAQQEAREALRLFHQVKSPAGEKRSQLILILAEQYEHHDGPCKSMAQSMLSDSTSQRYPWLFVQAQIENSFCSDVSDKQSLQAAQSGIETATTHQYPILLIRAIAAETGLYTALGDTHRAWLTAAKGLRLYWGGTYPKIRGYNALALMDEVNYAQEKWFLELELIKEAMPLVDGDPRTSMLAVEYGHLGQTLLQTGDFDGAEKSYEQAQSLIEKSAPGPQRESLSAEIQLGFAKVDLKRNDLLSALIRLDKIRPTILQIPDDLLVADYYATSGLSNFRSNHLDQAESDLTSAIKIAEKGLLQVETEDDRWKWSHNNEPVYRALAELKLHSDPREALQVWEWYKGAVLRNKFTDTSSKSLAETGLPLSNDTTLIFHSSDTGTALISFLAFPNGYAVWVWDNHQLQEKWVSLDESQLETLALRFTAECSDPNSDQSALRKDGSMLYQQLLQPIEPWISGKNQLIVEPDGLLKKLPLGLLVDSHGHYFGDKFEIALSPGVAYLNQARKWTGISRESTALVLSDPSEPGWAPLPDAVEEAHSVAFLFVHPRLLSGQSLLKIDLQQDFVHADVFHFSGHAQSSVQSTGLISGALDIFSPTQMGTIRNGKMQLAVLSACSTSHGTTGLFDDNDSMVRRLMGAHVPDVVASRWAVDSASTALLMKNFYSGLLSGKSSSAALNSAMQSVRSNSEFSHPYYWAGFTVFGRS